MSTALVRGVFDRYAAEFDAWFGENRALYLSELHALEAAGPKGLVLDLGVGSGIFASRLGTALGVDVSRKVLQLSKRRGLEVLLGDVKHLPVKDGAFDSVIISFTICFVDDAQAMLNEASRVLAGKGRLILGEITLDSGWGRLYAREGKKGHKFYSKAKFLTAKETKNLLSRAGFRIERAFGTVGFAPTEEPQVEEAARVDFGNPSEVGRYGFVCVRAKKSLRKNQLPPNAILTDPPRD